MALHKKTIGLAVGAICAAMMMAPALAFEFGAFSNVKFTSTNEAGVSDSFAIGGLDLYVRQQIDLKTEVFIEYVFESEGAGFVLDLERLYIKRQITDDVKVGMGRMHSPLGYWNNTYHHGVLIQDTVSRPSFLDFEDGATAILPTHVIGAEVGGHIAGVGYEFSLANSTFIDTKDFEGIGVGNISDFSDEKTLFYRLTYAVPDFDLTLGLSGLSGAVIEGGVDAPMYGLAAGDTIVDQTITALDLRYSVDKMDVLAEYYMMTNDAAVGVGDGRRHDATAYYVQVSYQLHEQFRPTVRYESLETEVGDVYFATLNSKKAAGVRSDYTATVVALRYDLDDSNALMLEYKVTSPVGGVDVTEVTLDWSFLLF